MKDCLWNNPKALRDQAAKLKSEGFDEAANGCLLRAEKVERLLPIIEKRSHLTRLLEEPVDAR